MTIFSTALRRLALGLAMAGATTAAAWAQDAYTNSYANVRSGPGVQYPVVGGLPAGTPVDILDDAGRWRRVRGDGLDGWVAGSLLDEDAPPVYRPAPPVYRPSPPIYAPGPVYRPRPPGWDRPGWDRPGWDRPRPPRDPGWGGRPQGPVAPGNPGWQRPPSGGPVAPGWRPNPRPQGPVAPGPVSPGMERPSRGGGGPVSPGAERPSRGDGPVAPGGGRSRGPVSPDDTTSR